MLIHEDTIRPSHHRNCSSLGHGRFGRDPRNPRQSRASPRAITESGRTGKSASVKSITLDDIKNHYKKYFTKNNITLGIAGNYSEEILKMLQSDMAKLPDSVPSIPAAGRTNQPNGIEVEIIAKESAFGSAIFTGAPLSITRSNNEFAAFIYK